MPQPSDDLRPLLQASTAIVLRGRRAVHAVLREYLTDARALERANAAAHALADGADVATTIADLLRGYGLDATAHERATRKASAAWRLATGQGYALKEEAG